MKDKFIRLFGAIWDGTGNNAIKCLIAPSYDEGTAAMSEWAEHWKLVNVHLYTGTDAGHHQVINVLNGHGRQSKLLMFIGHAKATGLLTQPGIGKADSPICSESHECLLDTEDIVSDLKNIHIVAWACDAGTYFGPVVAALRGSAFLGFNGPVNITINHEPSEQLWGSVIKELFRRVADRGTIESHDAEWLRHELLDRRRDLKNGIRDTGIHNRMNSMFLKATAKSAVVYTSKG